MMTIGITQALLHTWFHHPHGLMNPKRTRKPCNPLVLNNEGKQWTKNYIFINQQNIGTETLTYRHENNKMQMNLQG